MSTTATLERVVFETPRASEYFTESELQAQTGQPKHRFADVALKELADNGLDSAEAAGVPPELSIEVCDQGDRLAVSVSDNGKGIPPEVVERSLNFATRTSDKTTYRAPLRGMQGNGLKTVFGIPHALGIEDPVTIEAQGVRHTIRAWLDRAGELKIEHNPEPRPARAGTRVSLTLPRVGQDFVPAHWAKAFALFNPHALVKICEFDDDRKHAKSAPPVIAKTENSYHPTVVLSDRWRKFLPTDLTSPRWYDDPTFCRLVFSYITAARRGGRDLLLREFVRQFRGLSGTAKAKEICAHFPKVVHLGDFEQAPNSVPALLEIMKEAVTLPSPGVLGTVGKAHFQTRFQAWYGVKRFWYKKVEGEEHGIPFVFEVAVAETRSAGAFFSAVNFSPTFEDPLADEDFESPEFSAFGIKGFFERAHAVPDRQPWMEEMATKPKTAVAVHLVCPVVEFLDRGKTRLSVSMATAEQIAKAMWVVVQDLYGEEERRRKDAARAERRQEAREREQQPAQCSLKEAVFAKIPQAYESATAGETYDVSARDFYYEIRPLIQELTDKGLDFNYFSQQLLTEYRQQHRPLPKLYYKPRGVLYAPHTEEETQLGTREVESYEFPSWLYDKILYIEKDGVWQGLKVSQLAERFDMAVIAAEGYATEAARLLLARADQNRRYRIFVFHDADPYGYNIARTLREETRRMPGYQVDVVDLGLHLEDALAMGLQTEKFTRKKALPAGLKLTALEQRYFEGRPMGKNSWVCERVEINAMPVPTRAPYLERKLREAGASDKVVPPKRVLPVLAERIYQQQLEAWVNDALARLLSLDTLKAALAAKFRRRMALTHAPEWIEEALTGQAQLSWHSALSNKLDAQLASLSPELEQALWQDLRGATSGTRQ